MKKELLWVPDEQYNTGSHASPYYIRKIIANKSQNSIITQGTDSETVNATTTAHNVDMQLDEVD